jgi:ubiquinone/menaquinone biosynthesis C-methylase UbiE
MEGMVARWYARITQGDARACRELAASITRGLPPGAHILEIAPGPGYLAIELARIGRYAVFGVDISRTFVQIARSNALEAGVSVVFEQGDAAELPFGDACFDLVICRAAFKNFSNPLGALNEIHRVLLPEGTAAIFDLRGEASPQDVDRHVESMNLSAASALWTRLTFRFFLLKNAYTREGLETLVGCSRFEHWTIRESALEFDMHLVKRRTEAGNPQPLKVDPLLDPLRNDRRFQAIERALKFPN